MLTCCGHRALPTEVVCKSDPLHQPVPKELACKGDLLHQSVVADETQLATWVHILSVRLGIKHAAPGTRRIPRLRTPGVEESRRSEEPLLFTALPAPACTPWYPHLSFLFHNRDLMSMAKAERNTIVLVQRPWPTRSCALASRLLFKRQCRLQDAGESQVRMGLEHAVGMQTAGSVRLLTDDTGVCIHSKHPLSSMRFLAARTDACPGLWLSRIFAATDLGFAYCHVKYKMYKWAELDGSDVHRIRTPAACQQRSCRGSITSVVVAQRFCFPVRHCRTPTLAESPEQQVHLRQALSDTDVGLLEPLKLLAAARRQSSRSSVAFTPSARRRQQHLSCGRAFATRASSTLLSSPGVDRRAVTMDPQCCITSKRALSATRVPAARMDACRDRCLCSRILASTNLGYMYCRVKYKIYGWGELRGLDVHRMGTPATCKQRPLRRSITSIVVVVLATRSRQWQAARTQPGVWSWLQKLATARQSCLSARHCCVQVRGNAPAEHMHLQKNSSSDTDAGIFNVRKVLTVAFQRDCPGACTERFDAGVDACQALCLHSRRSIDTGLKVPERQLEAGRGGLELSARCAATQATCQQRTFPRSATFAGLLRNLLQPKRKLDPVALLGARRNLHIAVVECLRHLTLPDALRHCAADQKSVILDCGVAVSSSFGMFGGGTATSKAEGCCMVMRAGRFRRTSRLACRPLQRCSGAIAINALRTLQAQSRFRMWDRPIMSAAVEPSQSRPRKHAMNEAAMFHRTRFPWQPTQGATISERPRSSSRSRGRGRHVVNALFRDCLQDVMSGSHVEMEAAWEECGLDSLSSIAFARRLSDTFDLSFDATTFFDFSSPALLAKDIWDRLHDMELYVSPNRDPAQARTGAGQTWRNTDTRGCQLSPLNLQPKPGKVLYICPPFGFGRHSLNERGCSLRCS